ncbi:MAG: hypothetical protein IJ048_04825 [Clostridia bacterium]|nr:hypothetical protein [Clostridia bacterium]
MLYHFSEKQCLNGWWDFYPIYPGQAVPQTPPTSGCEAGKLLVPSHWNKPLQAVRRPGETDYHRVEESEPGLYDGQTEWLLDVYGYPVEWSRAKAGFIRRGLRVAKRPGKRQFIVLEAAGPKATLFVNARRVQTWRENCLPLVSDVTDFLVDGENDLAVLIEDYDRVEDGRVKWPFGLSNYPGMAYGILYDAWLVEKDEVHFGDMTIRTSVRRGELTAILQVKNASTSAFRGEISWHVTDMAGQEGPSGVIEGVCVEPGEKETCQVNCAWRDAKLWEPESPNLYWFEATLSSEGARLTPERERFGFREIWIEGKDLMMNGHPIHLFSDWGHRATPHPFTRGWVQKWFGMMRDMNLNHSRLHTAPHPEMILDMADEQGILITDETGIFGSGGGQAAKEPIYWERAFGHVRRFVRRDKNHPCVILWCCENEMRWNDKGEAGGPEELTLKYLPQIRKEFNALDPTRPAYHEGDSSCWNEAEQEIVSRHYGKECTGFGWWDESQPLHSGELGLYHYSGPNNTVQFGGDEVWRGMEPVNACALAETERLVTDARANGVCALGPWNYSCLLNFRHHPFVRLQYEDDSAPGLKPAFANACTCEFRYWEEGWGYDFAPGTVGIPRVFRPFAALLLSRRASFRADEKLEREIVFVNDTCRHVQAVSAARLTWAASEACCARQISVARGRSQRASFEFDLPALGAMGPCRLSMTVTEGSAVLDEWSVELHVGGGEPETWPEPVSVYGDGSIEGPLREIGVEPRRVAAVSDARKGGVLVVERNAVRPGSRLNDDIAAYCAAGGRVILLEQRLSAFPGIAVEERAVLSAFRRCGDHPALDGMTDGDLRYWSDAPYSLLSGDAYVAGGCYKKDDCRRMRVLVDTGEGNFGDGDLESALLFEAEEGDGLVIASQLNITARFYKVPSAARLLKGLLRRAFTYQPRPAGAPLCLRAGEDAVKALEQARQGRTLLMLDPDDAQLAALSSTSGVVLRPVEERNGTYACVKIGDDPALEGLSNADLCGIERFNYARRESVNTRVARRVLAQAEGLVPLAVTANQGLLREMFVLGGSTEILRVYTQSVPQEIEDYVVIGRLALGKGTVYVSLFSPENEKSLRLRRCENMLLRNLFRARQGESLLAGDIIESDAGSDGLVRQVYRMAVAENFQPDRALLVQCAYKNERMNAMPLAEDPEFQRLETEEGGFVSDGRPALLYYTIASKTPRKQEENDLALPDPMARTYLDVTGSGRLTVWVNAVKVGETTLSKDAATIPEIDIERGFNHVLVLWTPGESGAVLTMRWRNIMHEPERGFVFA